MSPLHWAGVNGSVSHTMSSRGKSSENNIAINPATDGLQFLISIHGFVHSRYISEPAVVVDAGSCDRRGSQRPMRYGRCIDGRYIVSHFVHDAVLRLVVLVSSS